MTAPYKFVCVLLSFTSSHTMFFPSSLTVEVDWLQRTRPHHEVKQQEKWWWTKMDEAGYKHFDREWLNSPCNIIFLLTFIKVGLKFRHEKEACINSMLENRLSELSCYKQLHVKILCTSVKTQEKRSAAEMEAEKNKHSEIDWRWKWRECMFCVIK